MFVSCDKHIGSGLIHKLPGALGAFLRRADEGTLSRLVVETAILLAASRTNPASVLRDAASIYKVDTDAITLKVKQEFAAKEKAKKRRSPLPRAAKKAA